MRPIAAAASIRRGASSPLTLLALTATLCLLPLSAHSQEAPVGEVKERVEKLRRDGRLSIAGTMIRASEVLSSLYERAGFQPIWTDPRTANALVQAVRSSTGDGLEPGDYHLGAIEALSAGPATPATQADLELLRSDALLRLAHDLRYGKVVPDDPAAERQLSRPLTGSDPAEDLRRMVLAGALADEISALRPRHPAYRGMMDGLAELRGIQERGGWEEVAPGPALRLGTVDPRVGALRRRLAAEQPRVATSGLSDEFDEAIDAAVRAFQRRHGLIEDGIVGPSTLRELNVPVATRIDQLRVNLERVRWIAHALPETYVAVNIPAAKVYLVRDGALLHEARAIVGRTSTPTPTFEASMRYIELNPTWTVPAGIVGEILDEIRGDPAYLRRMDMRVLDRSGRPVDPDPAQLLRYSARDFPYVFRQEPGPLNPLGSIKFVFPNRYNVYLHDTPSKQLFEREQRTFSHGCIRIEDPFRLAELILDDPVRWNRSQLLAAAEAGTRTITLADPLPVVIFYWTATSDGEGELNFYRDVYGRDAAVLAALNRSS